ncbi:MAG: Fe-S protein assembly co-chaperone HscB [Myxococcales bacterium]|nr:Fe-S protein assembly co-chaperone HscB [Myxococcales bacterium]MDP3502887.1 Fe-S protein assembly co-chaperone HscB [Myxococcales bacterium]
MTHFEVFGLAPALDVDVKALEQRHRELSLEFHPDRFAQADARTRLSALEKTTTLNDAFKVLRDPVKRAFYVLKLKGVDLDSEASAAQAKMPMTFLEEVMERREQLEALKAKRDVTKARVMADEIEKEKSSALVLAKTALGRDDVTEATHQLGRVRYYSRFIEEVEALEEEASS